MEHIASLSYGKDSTYMLEIILKYGYKLDRIITVDVYATPTIPAELPPVIEYKEYADKQIKKRYGIQVEHLKAKKSFEEQFYAKYKSGDRQGQIYGFPFLRCHWCNSRLKAQPVAKFGNKNKYIQYVGYAIDEKSKDRQDKIKNYLVGKKLENQLFPLVDHDITEQQAFDWCKNNRLLSPTYDNTTRGGCWFCQNQKEKELKRLRKEYPQYWELLLKWDKDSPYAFKIDGTTVHDLDYNFMMDERQMTFW